MIRSIGRHDLIEQTVLLFPDAEEGVLGRAASGRPVLSQPASVRALS